MGDVSTLDYLDDQARTIAEHRRLAARAGNSEDVAWYTQQLDKVLDQRLREASNRG